MVSIAETKEGRNRVVPEQTSEREREREGERGGERERGRERKYESCSLGAKSTQQDLSLSRN